ncbi:acyltransferase [Desulfovibrio sp. OttesenSCG-928-M16]|nr:acyltransferase [Desulfovibrio sp. OttesenSCG-928-M16]
MDVLKALRAFYEKQAHSMMERYNRLLPFGDLIADRWKKASLLGFGTGTSVYDSSVIMGKVVIGKNTWIGPYTMLDGYHAKLQIGDNCCISTGVQIYTHDSVGRCLTGGQQSFVSAATAIGNNTYIGPNVIIVKGVVIGNHCIIGANSYVNRSFSDFSVAWGQPAKLKGKVIFSEDGMDYTIEHCGDDYSCDK